MINEIYINGELILTDISSSKFKHGYEIRCVVCNELIKRKWYDKKILEFPYECKKCVLSLKNPMADPTVREKHTTIINSDEYKKKLSAACTGEKNGFYGKTHTSKTMDIIKEKLRLYWENMDDETYNHWQKMASNREAKLMENDVVRYKKQKASAARLSHISQFKNMRMNKIETTVNDYLILLGVEFEFSLNLASYQFDFGIKDKRILIEIDGDYWHGNPKYYNSSGDYSKRKLNEIQIKNQLRDIEKTNWAKDRGFTVIRIWETEINNNSYKNILDEIKKN